MGIVFRQSVKTTIVIFTGAALGAVINFYAPHYIPPTEFGFSRNIINQGGVLQYIILMGTYNVLTTFIPRYATFDVRRKLLITMGVIVPAVAIMLFCIPYILLRNVIIHHYQYQDIPYLIRYYYLLPLLVLLWSYQSLTEAYLITQMKIAVAAFAKEVLLRIGNIVLIVLFAFNWIDFDIFITGSVLMYALPLIVLFFIARRTKGFGFSMNWTAFSKKELRAIIHFSWYHLLVGITLNVIGFLDALLLPPLDPNGMQSLAIYSIAVFIASTLTIPYKAMSSGSFPSLNQAYIENNTEKLHDLFKRSGINILIVGVVMFLLIACNLSNIVSFLPASYHVVASLVLILMIGRLIDMFTGLNNEVISISSRYKFLFRISLLLMVTLIVFCRILIPKYSFYGAAWSATISLALFNLAKLLFLWVRFRLHPFSKNTFLVFLAGGIAVVPGYLVPYSGNHIADLFIRSIVIVTSYTLLLWWLKPSEDLQMFLKSVKQNKRLF